jgi:hypothetical protein
MYVWNVIKCDKKTTDGMLTELVKVVVGLAKSGVDNTVVYYS